MKATLTYFLSTSLFHSPDLFQLGNLGFFRAALVTFPPPIQNAYLSASVSSSKQIASYTSMFQFPFLLSSFHTSFLCSKLRSVWVTRTQTPIPREWQKAAQICPNQKPCWNNRNLLDQEVRGSVAQLVRLPRYACFFLLTATCERHLGTNEDCANYWKQHSLLTSFNICSPESSAYIPPRQRQWVILWLQKQFLWWFFCPRAFLTDHAVCFHNSDRWFPPPPQNVTLSHTLLDGEIPSL